MLAFPAHTNFAVSMLLLTRRLPKRFQTLVLNCAKEYRTPMEKKVLLAIKEE
jgi:hypothetical protein